MTQLGYRPPISWRLGYSETPNLSAAQRAFRLDITPWVLLWMVMYGCSYDEQSAYWTLHSATGHLTLDNSDAAGNPFDSRKPAAILADLGSGDHPIELRLGQQLLWAGRALVRAGVPLTADATVTWQLKGRWWSALRNVATWVQFGAYSTVVGAVNALLSSSIGTGRAARSAAALWPEDVQLEGVAIEESMGRGINRIAQASAAIPFEDHLGGIGISDIRRFGAGSQVDVPGTIPLQNDSTVESVPVTARWAMEIQSPQITPQPAATLATVATPSQSRWMSVFVPFGPNDWSIEWTQPQAPPGWSITNLSARLQRSPRGETLTFLVRATAANPRPGTISVVGRRLQTDSDDPTHVTTVSPTENTLLPVHTQTTPNWVREESVFPSFGQFALMNRFHNGPKARARLTYPLWAETADDALRGHVTATEGQFVPASMSRYQYGPSADEFLDMITETIMLSGSTEQDPRVEITGITSALLSDATGLPVGEFRGQPPAPDREPAPDPPPPDPNPDPRPGPAPTVTYLAWAQAQLRSLAGVAARDPYSRVSDHAWWLVAWATLEATRARYNPLATTLRRPGSTTFNYAGVQNYTSLASGVEAVTLTLTGNRNVERGYAAVLDQLLRASGTYAAFREALSRSAWSGSPRDGTRYRIPASRTAHVRDYETRTLP